MLLIKKRVTNVLQRIIKILNIAGQKNYHNVVKEMLSQNKKMITNLKWNTDAYGNINTNTKMQIAARMEKPGRNQYHPI